MREFRCDELGCKKCLGKIKDDGTLVFDSTRITEKIEIEKGRIICKNRRGHYRAEEKIYDWDKTDHAR